MATSMTPQEWVLQPWRVAVFLKKYRKREPFEMIDGSKVVFRYQKDVAHAMTVDSASQLARIRLFDDKGNIYRLSNIAKSREFGGKGPGGFLVKEDAALAELRLQIADVKLRLSSATIPIKINQKMYDVYDAETTPGTPRSDFHLVDLDGEPIAWISHKDGNNANSFQQWGSMSDSQEPNIFRHPEVQKFLSDLIDSYPNGVPNGPALFRKIKDNRLKMLAAYGGDFGRALSKDNVTVIYQGNLKLSKIGDHYEIRANHVLFNGQPITGDYEPCLTARFTARRVFGKLPNTRALFLPVGKSKKIPF